MFFASQAAIPFAYMSEYIARGAARKILSDTGENLVLRKTSRQNATQRTPTIFSAQNSNNPYIYSQY